MDGFKLVSQYKPMGDQPEAIDSLVSGIENGLDEQVLLGVTGSGKTFTMANVIARINRQDACGSAVQRVPGVFPGERGRIFCFLLRLLPA